MAVLDLVAPFLHSRLAGADAEIGMGDITMLRNVKPHADCRRVPPADLDVDVAQRGVKGAGIRVADRAAAFGLPETKCSM